MARVFDTPVGAMRDNQPYGVRTAWIIGAPDEPRLVSAYIND
jgi:hypothetical protein